MTSKPERNRTDAVKRAAASRGMLMREVAAEVHIALPMFYKILNESKYGERVRQELEVLFPEAIARWPWTRGNLRSEYGVKDVGKENACAVRCSLNPARPCPHRYKAE